MLAPASADQPGPAKKDSPRALKSKFAVFTPSVEPAEARPGETVTYKVTAKLDPGFHVYKYGKEQGAGPTNTSFDFFDTAGLKIDGDWTASQEPEKHKDPNFDELDLVEYHEDEVTWSIKLKIPNGTEPGKKVLRCQAAYQVCDAKQCSIPGRWTLPDVELTVLGTGGTDPKLAASSKPSTQDGLLASQAKLPDSKPTSPAAPTNETKVGDAPKPAIPDARPFFKPKNAVLTTSVTPAQAKPGDTVTFTVQAKLVPGSHIYKYSKSKEQGPGPANTTFDFFDPGHAQDRRRLACLEGA